MVGLWRWSGASELSVRLTYQPTLMCCPGPVLASAFADSPLSAIPPFRLRRGNFPESAPTAPDTCAGTSARRHHHLPPPPGVRECACPLRPVHRRRQLSRRGAWSTSRPTWSMKSGAVCAGAGLGRVRRTGAQVRCSPRGRPLLGAAAGADLRMPSPELPEVRRADADHSLRAGPPDDRADPRSHRRIHAAAQGAAGAVAAKPARIRGWIGGRGWGVSRSSGGWGRRGGSLFYPPDPGVLAVNAAGWRGRRRTAVGVLRK